MSRTTLSQFKKKALTNASVKKAIFLALKMKTQLTL